MKHIVAFAVTISVLATVFAGCNSSQDNGSPYQTNIFPSVKIPAAYVSDKRLAAEYVARHYWDEFLSQDRLLRLKPQADSNQILGVSRQIFQESFQGYVAALSVVDDTIAQTAMTKVVDKAVKIAEDGYAPFFGEFVQCAEKVLFDARSPMLNDQLYLPVLEGISRCSAIPVKVKDSYRYQVAICSKNRVGTTAANFLYATKGGRVSAMHIIDAEYLLIFFNDPDCTNCRQALETMKQSDVLINLTGMGVLKVLAVSPGGKTALWDQHKADFPADWIYAYSPDGELDQGTIYTLRASPSIYLLDREKKVMLKDASVPHALKVLTSISEHYVAI